MKKWHHFRYVFSDTPTIVAFTCSVQYCFKCNKAHSRCSGREFPGLTSLKLFHAIAHTWGGDLPKKGHILSFSTRRICLLTIVFALFLGCYTFYWWVVQPLKRKVSHLIYLRRCGEFKFPKKFFFSHLKLFVMFRAF